MSRLGTLLLIALFAVGGVAGPAGAGAGFVVKDATGREVALPAPPRRIVSLVPSVSELIFALGGDERLVGVTDFCDFPPAARGKVRVGGMIAPSLETIVALRPDVVVATTAGNREETFTQLRDLGIPVYVVRAARLADMRDLVRRLGELTGRQPSVEPLLARLDAQTEAVVRRVADRPRPRVLYVVWPEPLIVPAREALVTELIALAGGESVTRQEPGDYPRVSVEAVVARAPQVILLARHGAGSAPVARDTWDRLTALPAVRRGRVHAVDGDLVHRYGPRIVEGLEQLARAIHPEAFP
jgi:iron complex transport system substrate-binding protein